jgi:porin-like protein
MRKILLGTTAVVGAALLAPEMAAAQQAPTVRIGGYFRAYYGYTQQTSQHSTGLASPAQASAATSAATVNPATGEATNFVNVQSPNVANNTGSGRFSGAPASARTGKHDFSTDAEVHVFVNGKTANGLSYGAVVEIQFDANEGAYRPARRSYNQKTQANIDEMYAFVASPTLGQVRFGDEDGPFGGLMNSGWVTNFGTGGVYGDWESFVIRPNRTTTSPGGMGDNSKIIYLSPQFFGFDFGASWAFNEGEGADTGCVSSLAGPTCDRAYAAQGVTTFGRGNPSLPGRRNEYQGMARWRGNVGPVGLALSGGVMGSQAVNDISVTGTQVETLRDPFVWQVGAQATAYGFTLGGTYMRGNTNFFYIPTVRGDKDMEQYFIGGSYTAGPFTIGANAFWGTYAGASRGVFNTTTGGFGPNPADPNARGQRRYAYSVGANYRLAPGLDLVAEWVRHVIHENGVDQDLQTNNGVQDKLRAEVFLIGTRLAF